MVIENCRVIKWPQVKVFISKSNDVIFVGISWLANITLKILLHAIERGD